MSTYFGEVTALSSRAVYDDDDCINMLGEVCVKNIYNCKETSEKKFFSAGTIVFAVGEAALTFVKCYFLNYGCESVAVAKILPSTNSKENSIDLGSSLKPREVGYLYRNPNVPDILIFTVRSDISDEFCFDLCQQIMTFCPEVSQGAVLVSYHSSVYKSVSGIPKEPFLRSLATTEYLKDSPNSDTLYLEAPNIISGFAAAVMSNFEVHRKKAIMYACYTDVSFVDSLSITLFDVLLKDRMVVGKFRSPGDFDAGLISYLKEKRNEQANLYT